MEEALVVVLRPLEHQVLEEMREARAAGPLVLRADVVPDVHRNDRTVLIGMDQHVQAVVESVANEWNVHAGRRGGRTDRTGNSAQRKPLSSAARLNGDEGNFAVYTGVSGIGFFGVCGDRQLRGEALGRGAKRLRGR